MAYNPNATAYKQPAPPVYKAPQPPPQKAQAPYRGPQLAQGGGIGGFLNSNLGQSLITAAGSGLVGLQQARDQKASRDQQAQQYAQGLDFERALSAQQANPLGVTNDYVGRKSLLGDYLTNYKPMSFEGLDPRIANAMPKLSGGARISGFSPEALAAYNPAAIAEAVRQNENQLSRIDPSRSQADFSAMGFRQPVVDRVGAQNRDHQAMLAALNAPVEPQKKEGTPWWKKALKIGAMAAPFIAAPFTGGASLALIGAGAGAAGGALNGGGWKGALLGAGMGAIPMPGVGKAAGMATPGITHGLKQAVKNPALAASLLQR